MTAVVALALPAVAAAAGPNLIQNGSFEQPVVQTGSYQLYGTGQSFPGWQVVGAKGNVAPVSDKYAARGIRFVARSGKQWLDLTGLSNTATGVAQTVRTTPGATYRLTFAVGNVVDSTGLYGTTTTVRALVNGRPVLVAKNTDGGKAQSWKTFTTTFKATSAATSVSFRNGDPRSDNSAGLDAVSLTRG
jgi:hypothetical protein